MVADLKLAIHLQELDNRIRDLQLEVAGLPKHIAEIERTLESHVRKLEADRAALAANQRERKKLDDDIKVHEQKASKLKDQMMEARTNEQYRAFQKEIEYCQQGIRKAEDRILDLMSESEPLEQNVMTAEAALTEEKKRVEAEKQEARSRTAADQKELEELRGEREQAVTSMSPAVYAAYERIRVKRQGRAVAEVVDGRCSACHISLRPQFFQDVKSNETVMYCESCGRILYYTSPVTVAEDLASQPSPAGGA